MKPVLWVLQSNLTSETSEDKLKRFLEAQGTTFQEILLIPVFDDITLGVQPWDGPVIFYGSTSMIRRVQAEGKWKPGVFQDLEASSFPALFKHYGENLLNHDSRVVTMEDFLTWESLGDELFFVRPIHDTKSVIGAVREYQEWKLRLGSSVGVKGGPTPDTLIQVAEPKMILGEWRVCILQGKAITASTYRVEGKFNQGGDVPETVIQFAEKMAGLYSPQPLFMLDVADTPDGLKVIETNCFCCAGFYWMDVYEIARQVTDFVQKVYG